MAIKSKIYYDPNIQRRWFLDAMDMRLAKIEGTKRQEGKELAGTQTNKADTSRSDLDIHIFGVLGEIAVCRVLKIDPMLQWLGHDYNEVDEGIDLTLPNKVTIDVKTRKTGGDFALNPGRTKEHFKADTGVLVWLDNREATIVGAFDAMLWEVHSSFINFGPYYRWGYKGSMYPVENLLNITDGFDLT